MIVCDQKVDILNRSFVVVARDPEGFGELFNLQLAKIAPELLALFPNDRSSQGRKLVSTLGVLVAGLHDVEALKPMLDDLARRHVGYGVERHHYAIVGEALMRALECVLGEQADAIRAWQATYDAVASAMIDAAYADAQTGGVVTLNARAA